MNKIKGFSILLLVVVLLVLSLATYFLLLGSDQFDQMGNMATELSGSDASSSSAVDSSYEEQEGNLSNFSEESTVQMSPEEYTEEYAAETAEEEAAEEEYMEEETAGAYLEEEYYEEESLEIIDDSPAPNGHSYEEETEATSGNGRGPASVDKQIDLYEVKLGADTNIKKPGPPAELRVEIGAVGYESHIPATMVSESTTIHAVGETAKIKPFSVGFTFEPEESGCVKIDPTGTTTRFKMLPTDTGLINVGADVQLYDNDNCSGVPVPKAAATLKVTVEVDSGEIVLFYLKEIFDVTWEAFIKFWKWFVGFLLLVVGYIIREKIKALLKKMGIKLPDNIK